MKTDKRRFNKLIYIATVLVMFIVMLAGLGGVNSPPFLAFADMPSVITDLNKDSTFKLTDYPVKQNDYSLQVIQIAESTDGQLFIYVYQPSGKTADLRATQINMSLTDKIGIEVKPDTQLSENDKPKLYDLGFVDSAGALFKYIVKDFKVSNENIRYYNIVSIYRPFNSSYGDTETGNDNEINSVYFIVGKLYKAKTADGNVAYACSNVDTVEIKNPYVDFMTYSDGWGWAEFLGLAPNSFTDVHYIAFSTDRQIDTLMEADITYTTQPYRKHTFDGDSTGKKSTPQYKTLTREMDGATPVEGWFATSYTWKCIQTTKDFIKSTGIDSGNYAYEHIKDSEFVLVFHTTPYTRKEIYSFMQGHGLDINGTKVSDVSILRLMFETNGKVYNLGALMNQQEGDDIAGNGVKPIGFWAYIWRCIVRLFNGTATLGEQIVAVIVLFIILLFLPTLLTILSLIFPAFRAVMKTILTGVWAGIKYFFIGLWYIISAPFRLIVWIVQKITGGGGN